MARPMKPLVRGGGYYPSNRWIPLVYPGGYTTANGGEEPAPPPIEKTVIGNPIHITDALAKPAQALSVKLEPIQDLHGYDSPWPAGGGKNKLDVSFASDATSGAKYHTLTLKPNTAYTMSTDDPNKTSSVADWFLCNMDESVSSLSNGVWLNHPVTRTTDENGQLRIGYRCYEDWITPEQLMAYHTQLEEGSTATAYSPYSNICPISGWTECKVTRTGKNLLPPFAQESATTQGVTLTNENGEYTLNGTATARASFDILVNLPAGVYTLSANNDAIANGSVYVMSGNNTVAENISLSSANKVQTFMVASRIERIRITVARNSVLTNVKLSPVITSGSTAATAYEPYQGDTYNIQLGDTVYGGKLDVTGGKMVVDRAMVDLGTLNWGIDGTRFKAFVDGMPNKAGRTIKMLCDCYKSLVNGEAYDQNANNVCYGAYSNVYVHDFAYTDASIFKTAVTGHQLCYELATPIEITLTPTQIEMLLGENNLWSDGEMTLVYLADGNASDEEALNILLGGRYVNNHTADEPTDREALNIILGGNER